MDGLVANVKKAFDEYDPEKLNRIWLTHGAVLNQILENHGSNNYKLPHMYKDSLIRKETPSNDNLIVKGVD